jgi:FKBP-type peptidyl-prolyl cis-trans isomerase
MKWILLLSLTFFGIQAIAEQSTPDTLAEANAANKAQLLKGGKMSPKQKAMLSQASMADQNSQEGASFLANNKSKPGVKSLPDGLQYKILKSGKGKMPVESSSIRCIYVGKFTDGSTFDKVEDKSPAEIRVAGLLPGLKEAVKLMPVGSKWEVVIPSELAYGVQGSHGVAPNAVLIYVIEILGIK